MPWLRERAASEEKDAWSSAPREMTAVASAEGVVQRRSSARHDCATYSRAITPDEPWVRSARKGLSPVNRGSISELRRAAERAAVWYRARLMESSASVT